MLLMQMNVVVVVDDGADDADGDGADYDADDDDVVVDDDGDNVTIDDDDDDGISDDCHTADAFAASVALAWPVTGIPDATPSPSFRPPPRFHCQCLSMRARQAVEA